MNVYKVSRIRPEDGFGRDEQLAAVVIARHEQDAITVASQTAEDEGKSAWQRAKVEITFVGFVPGAERGLILAQTLDG